MLNASERGGSSHRCKLNCDVREACNEMVLRMEFRGVEPSRPDVQIRLASKKKHRTFHNYRDKTGERNVSVVDKDTEEKNE